MAVDTPLLMHQSIGINDADSEIIYFKISFSYGYNWIYFKKNIMTTKMAKSFNSILAERCIFTSVT